MSDYLNATLALLALINPVSKIFILSSLASDSKLVLIRKVAIKASLIALAILIVFAVIGNPLLKYVFHVNLYSFQIVGGLILLYRGFQALNKGLFFEMDAHQRIEDASIVPLASPMIAGPATITAAVSFPVFHGMLVTLVAITIAVFINLIVMWFSENINNILKKHNLMGALIRITGLIVATIGTQMMLDGFSMYVKTFS